MKIIGVAGADTFLVQMTEHEIANICGFNSTYDDDYRKLRASVTPRGVRNEMLPLGAVLQVRQLWEWRNKMNYTGKQAMNSAAFLRSLADLIVGAVPAMIIPPPEPEAPEKTDG